jgi:EVE domain
MPHENTWIFQANPDRFDIDAYLTEGPDEILFLVNQSFNQMELGDQVYIWRSSGRRKSVAGVIAEARIVELPRERRDLGAARRFWLEQTEADVPRRRAMLRVLRVADERTMIKRDWLVEDPIAKDLSVIRFSNATNFGVDREHRKRIADLWRATGRDWGYADAVAGLWAYNRTIGEPLSKLPGGAVAEVALLIGRAVSSVYNKVLNFRALDPRDGRAGDGRGRRCDQGSLGEVLSA